MAVPSLNLEGCDPIILHVFHFFLSVFSIIRVSFPISCFTKGHLLEKMYENNLYHPCEAAITKVKQISWL